MILYALESRVGQPFKYLERYHISHRKFSRAIRNRQLRQKWMKTRNFETCSPLKSKILSFSLCLKRRFAFTYCIIMIQCVLKSLDVRKQIRFLPFYHINHKKHLKWKSPSKTDAEANTVCTWSKEASGAITFITYRSLIDNRYVIYLVTSQVGSKVYSI